MWHLALFVTIGLGAGVLSGIFGIGGGMVIVPALIWFAKMHPRMATGTSLAALVMPVSILGAATYYQTHEIHVRASLCLAGGLLVGGFIGGRLAWLIDGVLVQRAFAVLLVLTAVKLWMGAPQAAARARPVQIERAP
jgi:uncharacterized membrane protein YfcA